ncbi:TonB-dependent receptor [Olivibacter sp. XZL3]|uniref:TonB-dependent receptor n=1 Tax=Olivibacter sp. XZL3 TaxID=1735116 RepID=UPI001064A2B0|nr:TonB-dependent receptor [Olivibacter sp. XZL3]
MNFLLLSTTLFSRALKTSLLIILFTLLTLCVTAQQALLEKKISVHRSRVSISEVLEEIETTTGCSFTYSPNLLDVEKIVTIDQDDVSVEQVLTTLFGDGVARISVNGNRINLQASEGKGHLKGKVSTRDGQPLGFATISVVGGARTMTDDQGNFTLSGVEAGERTLAISFVGGTAEKKTVEVQAGKVSTVNFTVEASEQALQEVEVTGQKRKTSSVTKSDIPLENLPMMVQIIGQEQLQQRQVTSIREAITNVSGVTYASSYAGGYDSFTGRGFALNIMRNGVAVSNAAGQLYGDNIEQIDVLKGPASIQYGDIAPGSVMNLVTKKPLDYDYKRFEMKLGQYSLLRPTFDISGPLNERKTVLFRLNSSLEKSNSFRDEISNKSFLFAPSLTWKVLPNLTWNLEGVYYDDDRTMDPGVISPDNTYAGLSKLRFGTFLGEPANVYRSTDQNIFSTLEFKLSDDWRLRNMSYYTKATREYGWMSFTLASLTEAGDIDRTYSSETGEYGGWGSTLDLFGKLDIGATKHHVLLGLEYLYDDRDRSLSGWGTLDSAINLYHPVYGQSTLIIDNRGTPGDPSTQRRRFGAYAQDQISLFEERLQLLIGLRLNHVERSSTWSTGPAPAAYVPDKQTIFNPRFGVLFKPLTWMSAFASYTNSFEMNGQDRFTGQLLDPSDSHQYEAGIKSSLLDDRFGITLAAFKIDKKNITGYVTGLTEEPTFEHSYYSAESGTATYLGANHSSKGLELDMNGYILPNLFFNGAFSYIDATIVDDPAYPKDNQLGGSPKVIANLWLNYKFQQKALKGFELGGGYSFRGKNYATSYNRETELVPDYGTVDLSVAYGFKNFFTRMNVTNLTDEKSYTYGMYGGYYPLWSRRAILSIGIKL